MLLEKTNEGRREAKMSLHDDLNYDKACPHPRTHLQPAIIWLCWSSKPYRGLGQWLLGFFRFQCIIAVTVALPVTLAEVHTRLI